MNVAGFVPSSSQVWLPAVFMSVRVEAELGPVWLDVWPASSRSSWPSQEKRVLESSQHAAQGKGSIWKVRSESPSVFVCPQLSRILVRQSFHPSGTWGVWESARTWLFVSGLWAGLSYPGLAKWLRQIQSLRTAHQVGWRVTLTEDKSRWP